MLTEVATAIRAGVSVDHELLKVAGNQAASAPTPNFEKTVDLLIKFSVAKTYPTKKIPIPASQAVKDGNLETRLVTSTLQDGQGFSRGVTP